MYTKSVGLGKGNYKKENRKLKKVQHHMHAGMDTYKT